MKFSTVFAAKVQLFAKSENSEINGKGITFFHEQAGQSWAFLGSNAQTLHYTNETLVLPINDEITYFFGDEQNFVLIGAVEPAKVTINQNGELDFGYSTVYATKDINDPYRYSKDSYAVLTREGGIPFTIEARYQ